MECYQISALRLNKMNFLASGTMNNFSRRQFLNTTIALTGFAVIDPTNFKKKKPKLSFSTLGCPDWDLDKILSFAKDNEYSGIEFRGLLRQMDLTKCPEFGPENIQATLKKFSDKSLKIVNLGSSAALHHADPAERKKSIEEGKSFIRLASDLKCPYIRVFPNNIPKDRDKNETLNLIAQGLIELGEFAKDKNVMVLMETHGEVVYTADIEKVMTLANHTNVGLVWDFVNMWAVTKEEADHMYERLGKFIRHAHIKDFKLIDGKIRYVPLGEGETPIFKAIDLLSKNQYSGYYSFEWEKMWHPEIEAPEIAFSSYSKTLLKNLKNQSR